MATYDVLKELPSGYFVEEAPGGVLAVHAEVARALHESGYGPETDGSLRASDLEGRKPLYELHAGGLDLVVRRFSHGGLMRWLTGDRYLDAERPFRELVLSDSLRRVGIRTPQVVAARARASAGFGWTLDVVSRRVPETLDLGHFLTLVRRGEIDVRVRGRVVTAVGELVRRLHRHDCLHADLNPRNMLVERSALEGGDVNVWLLDLDGSAFHDHLATAARRGNLRRLFRYVARRDVRHGPSLSRADYRRFFRGYDSEGNRWKEDWRAVVRSHLRRRAFHGTGWLLERAFGRKLEDEERGVLKPSLPPGDGPVGR